MFVCIYHILCLLIIMHHERHPFILSSQERHQNMKWFDAGFEKMSVTFCAFIKLMNVQCMKTWVSPRDRLASRELDWVEAVYRKKGCRPLSYSILGVYCEELPIRIKTFQAQFITKFCAIHCQLQAELVPKSQTRNQILGHTGTVGCFQSATVREKLMLNRWDQGILQANRNFVTS